MKTVGDSWFDVSKGEIKPLVVTDCVCVVLHEEYVGVWGVYVSEGMHEVASLELGIENEVVIIFRLLLGMPHCYWSKQATDSLICLWCHKLPLIFPQNWVALRLVLIQCMSQFNLIISVMKWLLAKILIFSYFFLFSFVVSLGANRLYTSLYALLVKYYS